MTVRIRSFCAGGVVGILVGGGLFAAAVPPEPSREAAPQALKYGSKVVLENDRVRVKEATFPPGLMDTGMHTHELPHVGVILTKGTLVFSDRDGKSERVTFDVGSVGYRDANVTHQVANPGSEPMRVIEVELK
jgi:mannose-6-phosphate isomerase-like protein (cupin superfamily)